MTFRVGLILLYIVNNNNHMFSYNHVYLKIEIYICKGNIIKTKNKKHFHQKVIKIKVTSRFSSIFSIVR